MSNSPKYEFDAMNFKVILIISLYNGVTFDPTINTDLLDKLHLC